MAGGGPEASLVMRDSDDPVPLGSWTLALNDAGETASPMDPRLPQR